jgi:hypothetical protein
VFSARLEEHNRILGKTIAGFGPNSVLPAGSKSTADSSARSVT